MGMAAAAWDVLSKAANLAQMSGLHAAMLAALLRVQQSNKRQCARLERCTRKLRALLQWPATGGVALLLPCSETGDPFGEALGDAAGLIESYKRSSLWSRLRSGGAIAAQLREMQDVVDSYCGLLLFVNAHLLLQQQQATRHPHHIIPTSSDTSTTTVHEENDTSPSPSRPTVAAASETQGANGTGQGGTDTDPATGGERNVPAHLLLPIVISHA